MAARGRSDVEIVAHPRGSWLVRVGDRRFAVPPDVGRDLGAGDLAPDVLTGLAEPGPSGRRRSIRVRRTLVSAGMTIKLSKLLSPWATTFCLVLMALFGAYAYRVVGLRWEAPGGPVTWLAGVALVLATTFWHELGHAAALQREGYPPGGIGVGILFVIPVLWADVTAVGALPRFRRLRVNLAGICFQLGAGGLCAVLASGEGPETAVFNLGALGALAAVAWSLIPFMRTDGYWVLCDLLGLDDLDRPPPAGSPRLLCWVVALFRIANGLFLCLVVFWVPRRIHGLVLHLANLAGLDPRHPAVQAVGILASLAVLGALAFRFRRRFRRLIHS